MKTLIKFLSLGLVTCFTIALIAPALVAALQAGGIGVMPAPNPETYPDRKGWFVYEEVEPGTVIEDVARIINLDNKPNTITIDAVDAFMTRDGGFALLDNPAENRDIGSWITLSETEITLDAQKEQLVPFTITIPENAEVGDHIGGIAVYRSEGTPDSTLRRGGTSVSISTRVGARVYLTIKGDIVRKLKLTSRAMFGRQEHLAFRFKMENQGNVRADLSMTAKIYGLWGVYDHQEDISLGQVFPKQTSTIDALWPGKERPIFGPYLARITLTDAFKGLNPESSTLPPSEPIHTWAFAFFVPWTQVAVLVFFLFVVWLVWQIWTWRRLVRMSHMPVVVYKVKKGDHIVDIAQDFGVSWKLLAKLNNIKSPYSLRGISQLYVPDARGARRNLEVPQFWGTFMAPIARLMKLRLRKPAERYVTLIADKGDTLKDIAKFAGISVKELATLNGIKKPSTHKVKAGDEFTAPRK